MSTLPVEFDDHAVGVYFTVSSVHILLADGREISAPLDWFPRLRNATADEREDWRLIGDGIGVHWPQVDEDIAVSTLMRS